MYGLAFGFEPGTSGTLTPKIREGVGACCSEVPGPSPRVAAKIGATYVQSSAANDIDHLLVKFRRKMSPEPAKKRH